MKIYAVKTYHAEEAKSPDFARNLPIFTNEMVPFFESRVAATGFIKAEQAAALQEGMGTTAYVDPNTQKPIFYGMVSALMPIDVSNETFERLKAMGIQSKNEGFLGNYPLNIGPTVNAHCSSLDVRTYFSKDSGTPASITTLADAATEISARKISLEAKYNKAKGQYDSKMQREKEAARKAQIREEKAHIEAQRYAQQAEKAGYPVASEEEKQHMSPVGRMLNNFQRAVASMPGYEHYVQEFDRRFYNKPNTMQAAMEVSMRVFMDIHKEATAKGDTEIATKAFNSYKWCNDYLGSYTRASQLESDGMVARGNSSGLYINRHGAVAVMEKPETEEGDFGDNFGEADGDR